VSLQHGVGLRFPLAPERDAVIGAGGHGAAVPEQRHRIHRVIVTEGRRPVGILTALDIVRCYCGPFD